MSGCRGVGVGVGVGVLVGVEVEVAVGVEVGVGVAEVGVLVFVAAATKTTCRVWVGSTRFVGNSTTGGALLQADRTINPPSTGTQE